jgi:ABC-type transporter Mla subunit MlaD
MNYQFPKMNKHETLSRLATATIEAADHRRRLKEAQSQLAELKARAVVRLARPAKPSTLTPETIRKAALAAGHDGATADRVASYPAKVAHRLASGKRQLAEAVAEIDTLPATVAKPSVRTREIMASTLCRIARPEGLTREEFNQLPPAARLKFCRDGGRFVDVTDGKTFTVYQPPVITRKAFNSLSPAKRLEHVKGGGKLTD